MVQTLFSPFTRGLIRVGGILTRSVGCRQIHEGPSSNESCRKRVRVLSSNLASLRERLNRGLFISSSSGTRVSTCLHSFCGRLTFAQRSAVGLCRIWSPPIACALLCVRRPGRV